MYKSKRRMEILAAVTLIYSCFIIKAAFGGIPEPGMILYGQVRDGNGALVTSGVLDWTFTPTGAGDPVSLSTDLKLIEGNGVQYSYSMLLPFETPVPDYPVSEGKIPLSESPVTYNWTAEITSLGISMSDSIPIALDDRGTATEIYVGVNPEWDKDGDGLPDDWEQIIIDHDPNDGYASIDDVNPGDDFDGDGVSNLIEFLVGTSAVDPLDYPVTENYMEDFETGDLTRFPWKTTGDGEWSASSTRPRDVYSAEAPVLGDEQSASLETKIYCDAGDISFWYSVSSETGRDFLEFYVDDQLIMQWSGDTAYAEYTYTVAAGWRTFRWTYSKNRVGSDLEDKAWIDDINFPGSPDSDYDGMPDGWESDHNLNPSANDSDDDPDNDGFSNIREFLAGTDPRNDQDKPTYDPVSEDFETGDLSLYPWVTTGYDVFNDVDLPQAVWTVTGTRVNNGSYAAESATLGNDQETLLETTMYTDGGLVSFWCSVSSEDGYDYLRFFIDGVEFGAWTGEKAFSLSEYSVDMGMHTFSWVYTKDEVDLDPVGFDSGWLDDITFPGSVDTDGDGLPDGWETDNKLKPLSDDSRKDPDGDGCNNKCEYESDTDPHVKDHIQVIAADLDNDGDVDAVDLYLFLEAYAIIHSDADLNNDGSINNEDLEMFGGSFGTPY